MSTRPPGEAWQRLVEYAETDSAKVHTVKQEVPNTIQYDAEHDAVIIVSQHHAASGDPLKLPRDVFITLWRHLQDGEVLSRDNEEEYTSIPTLLGDTYRASGVMGLLNSVFDEVISNTNPVRIRLPENEPLEMEIPETLHCLFTGQLDQRDGSYVIEIPDQELHHGTLEQDEMYRIAIMPVMSPSESDVSTTESP